MKLNINQLVNQIMEINIDVKFIILLFLLFSSGTLLVLTEVQLSYLGLKGLMEEYRWLASLTFIFCSSLFLAIFLLFIFALYSVNNDNKNFKEKILYLNKEQKDLLCYMVKENKSTLELNIQDPNINDLIFKKIILCINNTGKMKGEKRIFNCHLPKNFFKILENDLSLIT